VSIVDLSGSPQPDCPVCHIGLSIDLEGEAVDLEEGGKKKGKQGILGRLDLDVSSLP
jgi:DNA repair protein RAD16